MNHLAMIHRQPMILVLLADPVLRDGPMSGHDDQMGGQEPVPTVVPGPRHSSRETRRPSHLSDYV